MEPIVLASSSPRRQEILKKLNLPYTVYPSNIEEKIPTDIEIDSVPEYLAIKKVDAVARIISVQQESCWILGADTIIVLKGKIYGKPKDLNEAKSFLENIQGKTHKVITGLALYNGQFHEITTRTSVNKVSFKEMSAEEIDWYLNTYEWHDAAGAYRIQGFGSRFIKKIEGTESSIIGLPIFELYDMLIEQNYFQTF